MLLENLPYCTEMDAPNDRLTSQTYKLPHQVIITEFYKNYEIISVGGGKQENNLYFRDNADTRSFLPSEIGAILPKTTNYQTLVGITPQKAVCLGQESQV